MSLAEAHEPRYRNQFNTPWTNAAKQRLIDLWHQDLNFAEIARRLNVEFGRHWERCNIFRKAERLGLKRERETLNYIWKPELVARLKELWADPTLSATKIAARINREFNTTFTRSSVLGTVSRLGLQKRSNGHTIDPEIRRQRRLESGRQYYKKNRQRICGQMRARHAELIARYASPSIDDSAIPQEQRKTIMQLTAQTCRWPVGEVGGPGFFFCGGTVESDRPYCSGHCRRAYAETRLS